LWKYLTVLRHSKMFFVLTFELILIIGSNNVLTEGARKVYHGRRVGQGCPSTFAHTGWNKNACTGTHSNVTCSPCTGKTSEELGVAGGIPRICAWDTSTGAGLRIIHLLCFSSLSTLKTGFTPFGEIGFSCYPFRICFSLSQLVTPHCIAHLISLTDC
jgi:hypothetical protein